MNNNTEYLIWLIPGVVGLGFILRYTLFRKAYLQRNALSFATAVLIMIILILSVKGIYFEFLSHSTNSNVTLHTADQQEPDMSLAVFSIINIGATLAVFFGLVLYIILLLIRWHKKNYTRTAEQFALLGASLVGGTVIAAFLIFTFL
jgi:hypothetical protein